MARERVNGIESSDSGVESEPTRVSIADDGEIIEAGNDDGIPIVEPASIVVEPENIERRRRGGRPKGSRNVQSKQATKEVSADLTSILFSTHFMLSKMIKVEELELEQDEAKKLADAIARVNAEFGGVVVSPRAAALINLGVVGIGIYGPRLVAHNQNAKKAKAEKAAQPPQVIQ